MKGNLRVGKMLTAGAELALRYVSQQHKVKARPQYGDHMRCHAHTSLSSLALRRVNKKWHTYVLCKVRLQILLLIQHQYVLCFYYRACRTVCIIA
jgi:hypothetical protein